MKTSVLIFYLRLAKNTQIVLRYSSYFLLVVVNVAALVLTLMNIFRKLLRLKHAVPSQFS